MGQTAKLIMNGKTYELPIIIGSEGERGIDISKLRQETGLTTLDPGYANTGSCQSNITFMDGEKGILRYRGIPVEQLAEYSTFVETAYLLINGELPTRRELTRFSILLNDYSLVHEDMREFFESFPRGAHPMGILSSMVNALRAFYPEIPERTEEEEMNVTFTRLLSKVRTMAAMSYKISRGHKVVYPRHDLTYAANFLNMMFDSPVRPHEIDGDLVDALNVFWILHADHEQNCSTAAVRLVGSARVNLYAAISAGICALWGPLHGGANQAVVEMLSDIQSSGGDVNPFIARARDRNDPFRLMGFGHRVYKTYDPRARIMKKVCDRILAKLKQHDPLLDIARKLEEVALEDSYFIDHNLYPNVDFYSAPVYHIMRIPRDLMTPIFAMSRIAGWCAHVIEEKFGEAQEKPALYRPKAEYVGQYCGLMGCTYDEMESRG